MAVQGPKHVVVIWNDAKATLEELTIDEIKAMHKPDKIHTQGYIIVDDETGISIAGEWLPGNRTSDDDSYRSVSFIPKGMIQEVIQFAKPKSRRDKNEKLAEKESRKSVTLVKENAGAVSTSTESSGVKEKISA